MNKGIIIQASSRSTGNTFKIVSYLKELTGFDIIDLRKKSIGHFDYEFQNKDDDFNALFKEIARKYQTIVFATPIYWYTMSGLCKVFLDRISDFLYQEKEFGRMLKGRQMAVISCGNNHEIFNGFEMPFRESARYLRMDYLGHVHTWLEKEEIPEVVIKNVQKFINEL